jgi:hypothetical protein
MKSNQKFCFIFQYEDSNVRKITSSVWNFTTSTFGTKVFIAEMKTYAVVKNILFASVVSKNLLRQL